MKAESQARKARLERLARLLASPKQSEADCAWCRAQLPEYVEAEVEGRDAARAYPDVREHLESCLECQELYGDNLALVQVESANQLPQLVSTPQFDLSFLRQPVPSFGEQIYGLAFYIIQTARSSWQEELELIKAQLIKVFTPLADQFSFEAAISQPVGLALGFGDEIPSARWAVATLVGIQMIRAKKKRREIEELQSSGQLGRFLAEVGTAAAKQAGLKGREAKDFSKAFAQACSTENWHTIADLLNR